MTSSVRRTLLRLATGTLLGAWLIVVVYGPRSFAGFFTVLVGLGVCAHGLGVLDERKGDHG